MIRECENRELATPKVAVPFPVEASGMQQKEKLHFPGHMRIFCGGRIVMSGKNSWLVLTLFTIFLLAGFYIKAISGNLARYISVWVPTISIIWLLLALSMGLTTAWSDPGIIPRGINPRNTLRIIGATDYGTEDTVSRLVFHEQNPDFLFGKELIVNGRRVFLKFCGTCEIFRPPRCSHCSYCDSCVEEFDHHCPWLSNCIGKRNYRYFILFLFMITLLLDAVAIQMYILFYRMAVTANMVFLVAVLQLWPVTVLGLVATLIGATLTILTIYHLLLISQDMTTSEQVKMTRAASNGEPVEARENKPCLGNARRIVCGPQFPRMIRWQKYKSSKEEKVPDSLV